MVLAVANYLPSLPSLPPSSPRTPSFALATLRTPVQVRAVLANSSTNRPSHTHQFILGTVLFPSNVLGRAYYTLLSGSKHPHPDERESTGVRCTVSSTSLHLRYPHIQFALVLEHHGHFRAMIALNASTSPIPYQYACGIFHPVRKRATPYYCLRSGPVAYVVSSTSPAFTPIQSNKSYGTRKKQRNCKSSYIRAIGKNTEFRSSQ